MVGLKQMAWNYRCEIPKCPHVYEIGYEGQDIPAFWQRRDNFISGRSQEKHLKSEHIFV